MRWELGLQRPLRRVLDRSQLDPGKAARLTGAAVASYVVAVWLLDTPVPILAPLTALLVVQVTLVGILRSSVERVLSVVAGVLVATAFSAAVGITWWSLGLLIAASILVGQLLRLSDHLLEVPISAMIVLGAGAVEATALDRVVETLIGAAVGLAANLLLPPRIRVVDAAGEVEQLAVAMAELLERTARDVPRGLVLEEAERLVEGARRLDEQAGLVDRALDEAEESVLLNPRAIGTGPASGPHLRSALTVLEHTAVALRGLSQSIADAVATRTESQRRGGGDPDGAATEEARAALAQLLVELAAALRAFGRLVPTEVAPGTDEAPGRLDAQEAELSELLESLREARVRLTELLLVDPTATGSTWEVNGAILTGVGRVLRELDVEERARLRRRLTDEQPRSSTAAIVDRLRSVTAETTRQVTQQMADAPRFRVRRVRRARRRAEERPDG